MKIENLDFETAKRKIGEFKNSLIYYISSTELSRSVKSEINWDQCQEARFFSETAELRFFREGNEWIISIISDDGDEKTNDIEYELDNRYLSVGKSIIVREYLKADIDGQMVIVAKRLVSVR